MRKVVVSRGKLPEVDWDSRIRMQKARNNMSRGDGMFERLGKEKLHKSVTDKIEKKTKQGLLKSEKAKKMKLVKVPNNEKKAKALEARAKVANLHPKAKPQN